MPKKEIVEGKFDPSAAGDRGQIVMSLIVVVVIGFLFYQCS